MHTHTYIHTHMHACIHTYILTLSPVALYTQVELQIDLKQAAVVVSGGGSGELWKQYENE